ncbi:MAG: cation:proton antiporter [Acidimicrobiia bacterium]|nr:cation:proton antiporter [Acidimicrobiia bacterium]
MSDGMRLVLARWLRAREHRALEVTMLPEMDPATRSLLVIGGLLLLGLLADFVARHNRWLPRVTLLLALGIVAGPEATGLLQRTETNWFPVVTTLALTMIGFLVGGEFTTRRLRQDGPRAAAIAVAAAVVTAGVVALGLVVTGQATSTALLLGGIAAAPRCPRRRWPSCRRAGREALSAGSSSPSSRWTTPWRSSCSASWPPARSRSRPTPPQCR